MTSAIDVTKPTRRRATTASVRAQFAIAKSEIEELQRGRIEAYGGGPDKSGAQNVVAAQAALDATGLVTATKPGTWLFDAGLTIRGNTRLELAPSVTWTRSGGGASFALIKNQRFGSIAQKVSTIVSGAVIGDFGLRYVTLTFSTYDPQGGGWSAGDHTLITGDTSEFYNGIFRIEAVTSTGLTFFIAQGEGSGAMPDATGTAIRASLADGPIQIIGGTFDGNSRTLTRRQTYEDHLICIDKCLWPSVEDVRIFDVYKYCVMTQNCVRTTVKKMYAVTRSAGVQSYGHHWDMVVEDITGTYGDDIVTFMTIDGDGYKDFMAPDNVGAGLVTQQGGSWWQGARASDINAHASHVSHVAIYPNGGTNTTQFNYVMRGDYVLERITSAIPPWENANPTEGPKPRIAIGSGYCNQTSEIESISISNFRGDLVLNNSGPNKTITIDELTLDNPGSPVMTPNTQLMTMDYVDIKVFNVLGGKFVNGYGGGQLFNWKSANAIVRNLSCFGTAFESPTGTLQVLRTLANTGTLEVANFVGCSFGPNTAVVDSVGFSNTPDIYCDGCRWATGYNSAFTLTGAYNYNLHLSHGRAAGAVAGFFNIFTYTGILNVWAGGMQISGTIFANLTGTVNWYNPDGSIPVDLTLLARAAGSFAKHNGGHSAGTIPTNCIAVCDATGTTNSWSTISAGAIKTY